jgi:hypothetical protein
LLSLDSVAAQTKSANVCSTTTVETKNDTCPDASTFDVLKEYEKPASAWRIDFSVSSVTDLSVYLKHVDSSRFYVQEVWRQRIRLSIT